MKPRIFVLATVMVTLLAVICAADLAVGTRAPNFTLRTLDGKSFELSRCFDKPGSVVVLDLWATWCPPCQVVVPNLVKLNKNHRDKAFRVVGVALDEDKSDVQAFVKKHNVNYTVCTDPGGDLMDRLYKIDGIPALYVIDKHGVIRKAEVGFPLDKRMQAKKIKELTDLVDRLLAAK